MRPQSPARSSLRSGDRELQGRPIHEPEGDARHAILLLGHGSHIDGLSSDSVHELARKLRATGRHPEVRVAFWKEEPPLRHAFLLVESPEVVAVPFFASEGYFTERVLPRELRIDPPVSEVRRVVGPGEGEPTRAARRGKGGGAEEADEAKERASSSTGVHPRLGELDDPIRVHYTRAVGAHPAMADAVLERARDRMAEEDLPNSRVAPSGHGSAEDAPGTSPEDAPGTSPDDAPGSAAPLDPPAVGDTTLVVLGHGTERHPASGEIVERLTEELGRTSPFAAVACCFLDQDPRMLPVLESVKTSRAVVVPFFMAEGWHVGQTIPRDLNLEEGRSRVGSAEVLYAEPVGTHPAMVEVVEEMVAEAIEGAAAEDAGEEPASSASSSLSPSRPPLPKRAREAFLAWIDAAGDEGRTFLQSRVRRMAPSSTGGQAPRYEIRHVDDVGRDPTDLERGTDPEWACIVAARTDDGAHRPLKTAPDLRRGWLLEELSPGEVWEAYAQLYPAAPVHWYLGHEGALPVIPFRETAERQTGIYRVIQELDDAEVEETRAELCEGGCLRRVRWPLRGKGGIADGPATESELLCPEACSLFVTLARERAAGEESHHGQE